MRLKHFLCVVAEPFQKNFLPYKQIWSQRHNTSTFLLPDCFAHCVNWTSCRTPPQTEHGKNAFCWLTKSWTWIRSNEDTLRMGKSGSFPGTCRGMLSTCLLLFRVSFFLLFSKKCFSSLFFILPFSGGEWQREKENVVVCSEISSFLPTAAATGMEELRPFFCSTLSRAKWFSSWTRQSVWAPYSSLTFPLQLGFPLMLREWACFQFSVVKGIFSIWWI